MRILQSGSCLDNGFSGRFVHEISFYDSCLYRDLTSFEARLVFGQALVEARLTALKAKIRC